MATKACELTGWKKFGALDTLAAAYAEVGDFTNAIKWEQKSLQDPQISAGDLADYKSRLTLYQAGKPYRQSLAK